MNSIFSPKIITLGLFLTILFGSFISSNLQAEPYISFKTQQACVACHVNPAGGGMRTTYGTLYGYSQLPNNSAKLDNFDFAKINDFIKFGGDLRYDIEASSDESSSPDQKSFNVQSAQIYTEIKAGRDDLTLYLDQQISPGTALSREAMLIKRFKDGDYLKVGKMIPSLGLRIEDDSAFIRQVTGFNFDNSDNGVEYGLTTASALFNFFILNGTNSVSNDDSRFQFGTRAEFYLNQFRLGGALVINNGQTQDRKIASLFAGYNWQDFTLLGEIDSIQTNNSESIANNLISEVKETVGLIELNYEVAQGQNLKLTSEYHDPDTNIKEDQQIRHSIIYEYTPYSNIQLRFGFRMQEAPPRQTTNNVDRAFIQTHFYF